MLVLIMIEDMPADLGCKSIVSAATVDKALALINAQAFDLAPLDMNPNGNDSHPVAEALSARGVPFVYSTGNAGQSSRDASSDRPVLKKPFKYAELAAILARLELPPIELRYLLRADGVARTLLWSLKIRKRLHKVDLAQPERRAIVKSLAGFWTAKIGAVAGCAIGQLEASKAGANRIQRLGRPGRV